MNFRQNTDYKSEQDGNVYKFVDLVLVLVKTKSYN